MVSGLGFLVSVSGFCFWVLVSSFWFLASTNNNNASNSCSNNSTNADESFESAASDTLQVSDDNSEDARQSAQAVFKQFELMLDGGVNLLAV